MQFNTNNNFRQFSMGQRELSPAIKNILIINGVAFLLASFFGQRAWMDFFGLNPYSVIFELKIWQPLTYMFVHGGFWHLFMNMFMLWMFGMELERIWGSKAFMRFYLFTGVGSGFFSLIPYLFHVAGDGVSYSPVIIGASGAVYGVLLAYALSFPNRTVMVYFIMPMKVKNLMIVMGIITFLSIGSGDGISHITHLGGIVIAWLYLKKEGRYRDIDIPWNRMLGAVQRFFTQKSSPKSHNPYEDNSWHKVEDNESMRRDLDQLLDKISSVGYQNLSEAEKNRLLYLSNHLSGNKSFYN